MLGAKLPWKEVEKATSKKSLSRPPSRRTPCGQGQFVLSQRLRILHELHQDKDTDATFDLWILSKLMHIGLRRSWHLQEMPRAQKSALAMLLATVSAENIAELIRLAVTYVI